MEIPLVNRQLLRIVFQTPSKKVFKTPLTDSMSTMNIRLTLNLAEAEAAEILKAETPAKRAITSRLETEMICYPSQIIKMIRLT